MPYDLPYAWRRTKGDGMKKMVRVLVSLALVLMASSAVASICFGFEVDTLYFSNSAFTVQTGEFDTFCDGGSYSWGTTDIYRMRDRIRCCTGTGTHVCSEFSGGTWHNITCPW
jgi:hypothetical protein